MRVRALPGAQGNEVNTCPEERSDVGHSLKFQCKLFQQAQCKQKINHMKKYFLKFFLTGLLLIPILVSAQGLVPCGNGDPVVCNNDNPPVCGPNPSFIACDINYFFVLLQNIFDFIVYQISTPLAGLIIIAGGIVLIFSGGNAGLVSLGKRMLWGAIIGWLLVWGSYVIIYTVLGAIGFIGT